MSCLEMARQLKKMQEISVIQPSKSPCQLYYCSLKEGGFAWITTNVAKAENYPLPRIDDLLD